MSSNALQLWEYRDTEAVQEEAVVPGPESVVLAAPPEITEEHVTARVREELQRAEQRWKEAAQANEVQRRLQMQTTLQAFAEERQQYFRELEGEVVHLALAIARKILMREASLDGDLLAGMVRIALDRLRAGTAVKLRVPTSDVAQWEQTRAFTDSPYTCEVVADASLCPGDCCVETDRGTAHFGLEGQLKEIEEGLLDVLARRPPRSTLETETVPSPLAKAG